MSEYIITEQGTALVSISTEKPWRFKKKDGTWVQTHLKQVQTFTYEKDDMKINYYHYETADKSIDAKRVYIETGNHAGFIVDYIVTQELLCTYTDFRLRNDDGSSWCNIADKHKLVERNKEAGMKHFRLFSVMDGNDNLAKSGLLMPSNISSDLSIGYSMYEGLYSFGEKHLGGYGYCIDKPDAIPTWHFLQEGKVHCVEPAGQEEGWLLEVQDTVLRIADKLNPDCYMVFDIQTGELM